MWNAAVLAVGEHGTQVRAGRDAISMICEGSVRVRVCVRLRSPGGDRESNLVVWEAQRRERLRKRRECPRGEEESSLLKLRSSLSPAVDLSITCIDVQYRKWSHLPIT